MKNKINVWDHTKWKVSKPLEGLKIIFGSCLPYVDFIVSEDIRRNDKYFKEEYDRFQIHEYLIIIFNGKIYEIPNCLRFDFLGLCIYDKDVITPIHLDYKVIFPDFEQYKIHGKIYTFFLIHWLKFKVNKSIKRKGEIKYYG